MGLTPYRFHQMLFLQVLQVSAGARWEVSSVGFVAAIIANLLGLLYPEVQSRVINHQFPHDNYHFWWVNPAFLKTPMLDET